MKTLIVLIGPTGVGKTELSLRLAEHYQTCIVSADSRQLYADLKIGTAAPTPEQLQRVKHYLVGTLQLTDYYSAAQYEAEVLKLLETLFTEQDTVLLTGGSMMYVDAAVSYTHLDVYKRQTQGRAFEDIRKIVPNHFLLVPGVGAQGGSLEEVCKYGMNSTCGLIVNSSRGIIYVDKTEKFAEAARNAAKEVQQQMAEQLKGVINA